MLKPGVGGGTGIGTGIGTGTGFGVGFGTGFGAGFGTGVGTGAGTGFGVTGAGTTGTAGDVLEPPLEPLPLPAPPWDVSEGVPGPFVGTDRSKPQPVSSRAVVKNTT